MYRLFTAFFLTAFPFLGFADPFVPVRIADLKKMGGATNRVTLTGRVLSTAGSLFALTDGSGTNLIRKMHDVDCGCGDLVRVKAIVLRSHEPWRESATYASVIDTLERCSRRPLPSEAGIRSFENGDCDYRTVILRGTITDVFRDELDSVYIYLTFESEGSVIMVGIRDMFDRVNMRRLQEMIGQPVRVTGVCVPHIGGPRRYLSRTVFIESDASIDPLDPETATHPAFPQRITVIGTVLAPCDERTFYVRTEDDERFKVHLAGDQRLPPTDSRVSIACFRRNNIFFSSLHSAIITGVETLANCRELPRDISPRQILHDKSGDRYIPVRQEGHSIRLRGRLASVSEAQTPNACLILDCDGTSIPVRIGAIQIPPIDSEIEVSGICSINIVSDGNPHGFVRLTGFTLLTRGPEDVVILKNPPWWTPAKMLAVIAALLLLVVAVLIWNKALRTLAERRGRELMDEQLGHVAADLKVNERTRLAVELHDALSQNLTGVSLQLDAVKRFADEDRGKMARHLDMAMRTLKSCRDELRNCLWDLRNRALEETDMNEAIRRTASPFVGDAALLIRFNVPRDQISDNTAHALMRIIRELATNAVRHGGAKTIRIAGTLENGRLLFSVSDDGGGFDPQRHPGVDEGHFGLDGIRERVEPLGGSVRIESTPNKGSTIRISMTA